MSTTKVKTADLDGPALDWAVAEAQDKTITILPPDYGTGPRVFIDVGTAAIRLQRYWPSTDWSQCGLLIDQYKVAVVPVSVGLAGDSPPLWISNAFYDGESHDRCHPGEGTTPQVAVCRAVVGLFLGDTVQVPSELLNGTDI